MEVWPWFKYEAFVDMSELELPPGPIAQFTGWVGAEGRAESRTAVGGFFPRVSR